MLDLSKILDDFGSTLHVRVTAKASMNKIKVEELADGKKLIRVYVTAVAADGKANKEVIKLLAKALGIPPSSLSITRGLTSRDKVITVDAHAK